jgi:hypothetical protein
MIPSCLSFHCSLAGMAIRHNQDRFFTGLNSTASCPIVKRLLVVIDPYYANNNPMGSHLGVMTP